MKKVITLLLALAAAAVLLCACGEEEKKDTAQTTAATEAATAEATEAATEAATENASDATEPSRAPVDVGDFKGNWICEKTDESLGYETVELAIDETGFTMTMTEQQMAEVSAGYCEKADDGSLLCYCTGIRTYNLAQNTIENEATIPESERENAKMTVTMKDSTHIIATNFNNQSIELEKDKTVQ